ncbi:calcium-binding protein [Aurantimonas sp. 22II-16-19i]|uniref:calcium-binding protein n=1 Tax=Aurantimonas sp. 22II-16-19i TaxID=1317114 RepID=UPI0009F7B194|nr:calcium-binding protein [Aurantimonas sp. 22II-16-19i]ORE97264.1 5'-nucleotidase [Aurantimonas sp. 22II-16-19i]
MTTVISTSQAVGLNITDVNVASGPFYVLPNVSIQSDAGSGGDAIRVTATTGNAVINVAGMLIAGDDGVSVNGGDRVVLTSTGSIFGSYGFFAPGGDGSNVFVVDGLIDATVDAILLGSGNSGNSVTIGGHVMGGSAGVNNSSGNDNTVRITDGGVLEGASVAYAFGGNLGTQSTLVNHGTILGGTTGAVVNSSGDAALAFTNAGLTDGDVTLGTGADTIVNSGTILGAVDLGGGVDTFTMLGSGTVTGDIAGGAGNDIFRGGDLSDRFLGGDDNDTFYGGGGNDLLFGEAGNDRFFADTDAIADTYNGGDGSDTVNYLLASGDIRLNFGLNYALGADIGVDRLFAIENAAGGAGNDSLTGSDTTITLAGGAGDDTLFGGTGNNILDGGDGADVIRGFAGFDKITGGAGDDSLTGDFNADTFIFADGFGKDTITDFDELNNAEKINLAGVTAITDFTDLQLNHLTQVGANAVITDGVNTITLLNVNLADLDANDFII